jgi:hypothetical protein
MLKSLLGKLSSINQSVAIIGQSAQLFIDMLQTCGSKETVVMLSAFSLKYIIQQFPFCQVLRIRQLRQTVLYTPMTIQSLFFMFREARNLLAPAKSGFKKF